MLKSSLLLIFILNIYFSDLRVIGALSLVTLIINIIYNKDFIKNLKTLKLFFIFYIGTFIIQFIFNQDGEVLFKVLGIYITREGLMGFLQSFFRIINLLLLSWIASYKKVFGKGLGKYQRIVETVIMLVPEVLSAFKRRMKLKSFFRGILKQIKVKI